MVLQPLQARVGLGPHSFKASSRAPQSEAGIARLKKAPRQRQQIEVATGQLAWRFAVKSEQCWTPRFEEADNKNGGVAGSRLRIVRDGP
jgi:hypothetical protein